MNPLETPIFGGDRRQFWRDGDQAFVEWLELRLPLPPPDNNLHRRTGTRLHPTVPYVRWLRECAPLLAEVLGDRVPDTERWWKITGQLHIGSLSEMQNHLKAIPDLLRGRWFNTETRRVEDGPGWFDDDNRVVAIHWHLKSRRQSRPWVRLEVEESEPPVDARAVLAELRAKAREEKKRK